MDLSKQGPSPSGKLVVEATDNQNLEGEIQITNAGDSKKVENFTIRQF